MPHVVFPPSLADITLNPSESFDCIRNEFDKATSSNERSMILDLFVGFMRALESSAEPSKREAFSKSFRQIYIQFLITESQRVNPNDPELMDIDPELMEKITGREILAGRMAEDDGLRMHAVAAANEIRAERLSKSSTNLSRQKVDAHTPKKSWLPWRR